MPVSDEPAAADAMAVAAPPLFSPESGVACTEERSYLTYKAFLLLFGKGNHDQNVYEPLDKKVIFELSKFSFAEAKQTPTTSKLIKLINTI